MKKFLLVTISILAVTFTCHSQITITKDYFIKGKRIVEFLKDGVSYSMSIDNYDVDGKAEIIYVNPRLGKNIDLQINIFSDEQFLVNYGEEQILSMYSRNGEIHSETVDLELNDRDRDNFEVFSEAYNYISPQWPLGDGPDETGPTTADFRWRLLGVRVGGTESLAEARCESLIQQTLRPGCESTIDCVSAAGDFLTMCVCGEICKE